MIKHPYMKLEFQSTTNEGELISLSEAGITSINLNATSTPVEDNGNIIREEASFTKSDGTTSVIADVEFDVDQFDTQARQEFTFDIQTLFLPLIKRQICNNLNYINNIKFA